MQSAWLSEDFFLYEVVQKALTSTQ